jgi:hypothetical protein
MACRIEIGTVETVAKNQLGGILGQGRGHGAGASAGQKGGQCIFRVHDGELLRRVIIECYQ